MKGRLSTIVGALPASRMKNGLLRRLGHEIARDAVIGPILIVSSRLVIGAGCRIGPFNVIRNVPHCEFGLGSELGQWNWISAAPFLLKDSPNEQAGFFIVGAESAITSRHYFDASGGVIIGDFVTIAGVRSAFMTHGIDVADAVLDTASIEVGDYAMVGGSTSVVLGARVPAHSVIAMGSVVIKGLTETYCLYAGSPARPKKKLSPGKYSTRAQGPVGPRWAARG